MKHYRVNTLLQTNERELEAELADEINDTVEEVERLIAETKRANESLSQLAKVINGEDR